MPTRQTVRIDLATVPWWSVQYNVYGAHTIEFQPGTEHYPLAVGDTLVVMHSGEPSIQHECGQVTSCVSEIGRTVVKTTKGSIR